MIKVRLTPQSFQLLEDWQKAVHFHDGPGLYMCSRASTGHSEGHSTGDVALAGDRGFANSDSLEHFSLSLPRTNQNLACRGIHLCSEVKTELIEMQQGGLLAGSLIKCADMGGMFVDGQRALF